MMEKKHRGIITNQDALSLIEVLITISILALVLYPLYEFLRQGALSWETGENKTEVVQNARIGLDRMCDEIKHAHKLYSIAPATIRFWWKDVNDNDIADANEILTFFWSGTSGNDLTRKFDAETAATPLANYVDDFSLRFYDKNGIQTSVPADVHFLTASLKIKKSGKNDAYTSIMRKSVYPRNL
jgi:hypothetical protein